MTAIYVETEAYRRAVAELAAIDGPNTDQIKIWLGENYNIWPASIRADANRPLYG
ncbi:MULTISPECIES: hypothetical protein [Rhodopseudomonas]|uniref:hypothetical protein n=1 Tax=Rhodopseudomonas TaxID=1073 RepID=UPI001364B478|nr:MULTISPECIES: hypothetical protein [Rhodopseudomonas]MDF3810695.1 hypothetical protein [Rhodopseudomonas sp. BAL398]WOK18485.1 hypothetical protein RBJ75_02850 [Rhodopseudomonas sp. BAL398]